MKWHLLLLCPQNSNYFGDKTQFFSPEDSISLSLEYYQVHLDNSDKMEETSKPIVLENTETKTTNSDNGSGITNTTNSENVKNSEKDSGAENVNKNCDKRFLQCPAGVSMKHLQKFIRMKFGLNADHRVSVSTIFISRQFCFSFFNKIIRIIRFFYIKRNL